MLQISSDNREYEGTKTENEAPIFAIPCTPDSILHRNDRSIIPASTCMHQQSVVFGLTDVLIIKVECGYLYDDEELCLGRTNGTDSLSESCIP